MYFYNLTKKEMHLVMFSQNALAETWYISCSLSYPLLAPTKRELSGPRNRSCSLELSAKPKPTSDPGWEVSTRWLWIIQSHQEAETSPHPNLTVGLERELSLGRQECRCYCYLGAQALLLPRDSHADEDGKAIQHLTRTCPWHSRYRHFTQKYRMQGKCSWPESPIFTQLKGRRASSGPWVTKDRGR